MYFYANEIPPHFILKIQTIACDIDINAFLKKDNEDPQKKGKFGVYNTACIQVSLPALLHKNGIA